MGKFDDVLKFLGKEDTFAPEQIEQALNKAGGMTPSSEVSSDEVSPESLANIDALLSSNFPNFAASPADQPTEDLDNLSEIPVNAPVTEPPPPIETTETFETPDAGGDFPDLSDFQVDVGGEEPAADDFSSFDMPSETEPAEDFGSDDAGYTGEDQVTISTTPIQSDVPEQQVESVTPAPVADNIDLDADILQEIENLDSAPPPLEDIQRRAVRGGQEDLIADMLEEQQQESEAGAFDLDYEVADEGTVFADDLVEPTEPAPVPHEEGESSDMMDLLKKFTAEEPKKSEPIVPDESIMDFDKEERALPESGMDMGMGDLENMLGGEVDLGTGGEEPAPEPSGGMDFDLEPSEGAEAGETSDDLMDLMATAEEEETGLKDESFDIGEEPSDDFSMPDAFPGDEQTGAEPELPELSEASEEPADFDFGAEPDEPDFSLDTGAEPDFGSIGETSDAEPEPEIRRETSRPSFDIPKRTSDFGASSELPDMEMDADKALKIRAHINKMSDPDLRKKLRHVILGSVLAPNLLEQLLAMLLLQESEDKIQVFASQNFPKDMAYVEEAEEAPQPIRMGRRVIHTQEAKKSQAFAKEIQNVTRYAALIFVVLIVLGFVFWRFVFKPSMANRKYNAGMAQIELNEYDKAEQFFLEGMNIGGPNIDWFNKYALAYIDKRQFDRAEDKFMKALERDPNNPDTIINFATYYKSIYPPQYQKAIDLYSVLHQKNPDDFGILNLIGKAYIEWGDSVADPDEKFRLYGLASEIYTKYLVKDPRHILSYMKLLQLALRVKNEEKIDMMYDTIDKLNPTAVEPVVFTELAEYYVDMRKMDKAKSVFTKLMSYVDNRIKAFNRRRNREDITSQEKLLFAESYYQYARYLTVNLDFMRAIAAATNATIFNPRHGRAYNLMGEIYYVSEMVDNHIEIAKSFFETATNYAPDYYKPYANLGHIYYYENLQFNDPDLERPLRKALQNYAVARALLPPGEKDYLLQYNLSWLYYHNANYEAAFREWSDLYVDRPSDPVLSYAMGCVYYHLNQPNLAEMEFAKAIAYYQELADNVAYINPTLDRHIEIYTQLARSYNNRGVIYARSAQADPRRRAQFENGALLDFQRSKNEMNKINQIYEYAEVNIKYILNREIRGRQPAFDESIPKRTTLTKWIEEFRQNLIGRI